MHVKPASKGVVCSWQLNSVVDEQNSVKPIKQATQETERVVAKRRDVRPITAIKNS